MNQFLSLNDFKLKFTTEDICKYLDNYKKNITNNVFLEYKYLYSDSILFKMFYEKNNEKINKNLNRIFNDKDTLKMFSDISNSVSDSNFIKSEFNKLLIKKIFDFPEKYHSLYFDNSIFYLLNISMILKVLRCYILLSEEEFYRFINNSIFKFSSEILKRNLNNIFISITDGGDIEIMIKSSNTKNTIFTDYKVASQICSYSNILLKDELNKKSFFRFDEENKKDILFIRNVFKEFVYLLKNDEKIIKKDLINSSYKKALSKTQNDSENYINIFKKVLEDKTFRFHNEEKYKQYIKTSNNLNKVSFERFSKKILFQIMIEYSHKKEFFFKEISKFQNSKVIINYNEIVEIIENNFHKITGRQLNFIGNELFFKWKMENLEKEKNILKSLNPKKFSFKTKQMITENILFLYYISNQLNYSEFGLKKIINIIVSLIDNLKFFNISEKSVRGYLNKYLIPKTYLLNNIDNNEKTNLSTVFHNIFVSHFENLNNGLIRIKTNLEKSKLNENKDSEIKIRKITERIFNFYKTHNLIELQNSAANKDNLISKLNLIYFYFSSIGNIDIKEINNLKTDKDFNLLISKIKDIQLEKEINNVRKDFDLNNDILEIYKKNDSIEILLGALKRIKSSPELLNLYNLNNDCIKKEEYIKETDKYRISLLNHKNFKGLLGKKLPNVCISVNSNHSLQHLNPSFFNIVIDINENLSVWGLLIKIRNSENNKTSYILNNLQGSINNKNINKDIIKKDIYEILNEFKLDNDLEYIFINNVNYNIFTMLDNINKICNINNDNINIDNFPDDIQNNVENINVENINVENKEKIEEIEKLKHTIFIIDYKSDHLYTDFKKNVNTKEKEMSFTLQNINFDLI